MLKKILIILPTRNRPKNVKRFYGAWAENHSGLSDVVLMVDEDDENEYHYQGWKISKNPRLNVIQKLNKAYRDFGKDYAVIGFLGDDSEIKTHGFDEIILDKLAYQYSMLRPSNGYDVHNNVDHVFFRNELLELIGYMAFEKLSHACVDYIWRDVGEMLNKIGVGLYLNTKDVVILHHHPHYNSSVAFDAVYESVYNSGMAEADHVVFQEEWPKEREEIRNKMLPLRPVVYTCITGGRDRLRQPSKRCSIRHCAFLEANPHVNGWEYCPFDPPLKDPIRSARHCKINTPLTGCDTLWVDGNIVPVVGLSELMQYIGDADICVFKHKDRDCIYEEAEKVLCYRLDDYDVVKKQMKRYEAEGYPKNNGLCETGVLFRKNTPRVAEFNKLWWNEVANGSKRDQLSFNYCLWRSDLKVAYFPGTIVNNELFSYIPHD